MKRKAPLEQPPFSGKNTRPVLSSHYTAPHRPQGEKVASFGWVRARETEGEFVKLEVPAPCKRFLTLPSFSLIALTNNVRSNSAGRCAQDAGLSCARQANKMLHIYRDRNQRSLMKNKTKYLLRKQKNLN